MALDWVASGLSGVTCRAPQARAIAGNRVGHRARVSVVPARPGDSVDVEIAYAFRLGSWPRLSQPVWLPSSTFPSLVRNDPLAAWPRPWLAPPETLVQVTADDSSTVGFGSMYTPLGPLPTSDEAAFGVYHAFQGVMCIAKCEPLGAPNGTALFAAQSFSTEWRPSFSADLGALATRVREYYTARFGNPAVRHGGLLLFAAPHVSHYSLGSYLALNVVDVPERQADVWQAAWLYLLAHEYAHTWWAYGAVWDRAASQVANEALAAALEVQCVKAIGGVSTLALLANRRAHYSGQALGRSARQLRRLGGTTVGFWPGSLLFGVSEAQQATVDDSLLELWEVGRREALSLARCQEILDRQVAPGFGAAFAAAIRDPRPIVARCRVAFARASGHWVLEVKPPSSRREELLARLKALLPSGPRSADDRRDGVIRLHASTFESLSQSIANLRPPFFVAARRVRGAALSRRPGWLRELTAWSKRSSVEDATGRAIPTLLAASICALLLNWEDPAGFLGLAAVLEPLSRAVAGRLRRAAGARAIEPREAEVRRYLVVS